MRNRSIELMVEDWVAAIEVLSKIAHKYPQSAYHGFTTSLQAEWQYLCRCVPGVGQHLTSVEAAIKTLLIPALLELPVDHVKAELRTMLSHGSGLSSHIGPPLPGLRGGLECPRGLAARQDAA